MPLLLLDLDNTLVDRAAAVRAWAAEYLTERGAGPDLLEAVVAADGDGLRPKPAVAADLTSLLGLSPEESAGIIATLRAGVVAHLRLVPDAEAALLRARDHGWTPFIVTNGQQRQQDTEAGARSGDALHIDQALMLKHNPVSDRKAQACAVGLGGKKGVEDLPQLILHDAAPDKAV